MTASPLQAPYCEFLDDNGDPLSGGLVYTYTAGTTTPKASYTDSTGLVANTNPVVLDSAGRADIWLIGSYRIDVKTSTGTLIKSTDDFTAFSTGGDMTAAVYDPAGVAQQLVGQTIGMEVGNKDFYSCNIDATCKVYGYREINAQTGTSYTLVAGDAGKHITLNNSSSVTVTVPENATVPFLVGTETVFYNIGDGSVKFSPAGAAAIQNNTVIGKGSWAILKKVGTDSWTLSVGYGEQFISLTSTYTLTSQTAAQKLFNSSTNGALTVTASTSYFFQGHFSLSSMAASGSFGFALGGTATLTSVEWQSVGVKTATLATAAAPQITFNATSANTAIVTAGAATNGYAFIKGIVRINAGGTLIPQVSLGTAAAAVVGVDSWFRIIPIGTNTVTHVGDWS